MAKIYGADIGNWYQTADGRVFRIISIDGKDETLEIQYADGDLEELDVECWYEIEPMPIDNPASRDTLAFDTYYDRDPDSDTHTLSEILGAIEHYDYKH